MNRQKGERAILGARPSTSFSNRMKRSRREGIVGQSLVDCTLYRKWVRAGGWFILLFCFKIHRCLHRLQKVLRIIGWGIHSQVQG